MDFSDFKTGKDDEGRRLDKVVRIFISDTALSAIYKSIRKGLIKVNSSKAAPDYRIQDGDVITIADVLLKSDGKGAPAVETSAVAKEIISAADAIKMIEKIRVFENGHLLVLNKPAGMNVHASQKDEISLQAVVQAYYKASVSNDSLSFKPGPLHRIDKYTSGLVCFSKSTQGAVWFSQNMKEHKIKKTYEAVLQGHLDSAQEWIDYLEKEDNSEGLDSFHTVKVYASDDASRPQQAKQCITKVIPERFEERNGTPLTHAKIQIETGRQHQIRAQSAFHGFPLWGDTAYGGNKTDQYGGQFYLVAKEIEFPVNELDIPLVLQVK